MKLPFRRGDRVALNFILGNSGAGKTHFIYETMIQNADRRPHESFLLIVPEQYTLQTQQELIANHPRKGIISIEVLSFQRLAYRIYDDLGIADKVLLKDTGKNMVIRRLVEKHKHEFSAISRQCNKKGFINELKAFITESYQYGIDQETIEKMQEATGDTELKSKLSDLQILLTEYKSFLEEKYFTSESTMDLLVEGISKNSWLSQANIYIDGFYGFTPIQYRVIEQLLLKAKSVHVSITINDDEDLLQCDDETQLFFESKKVYNTLSSIANKHGIHVESPVVMNQGTPRYCLNPALEHIEKFLYRYPIKVYSQKQDNIYISQASNMRRECQYVADSIMKLCMEQGYRYKDITVLTGDLEGYGQILVKTFNNYGIPFFIDQKKSIIGHTVVTFILSALECIYKNFSYMSIFRYIKSGLLDVEKSQVDMLENYVIAYGVQGFNAWNAEWNKYYPYADGVIQTDNNHYMDKINEIRNVIIEPLGKLREVSISKNVTVFDLTKALYDFMQALRIDEKMLEFSKIFGDQGQLLLEREYKQIYPLIIDVLEQMADILGDQPTNIKDFHKMLEAGFEACEMGVVPPGLDQVLIGDVERSRIKESRALFVLGLNEGKIPKVSNPSGFITDAERDLLTSKGFQMSASQKMNAFKTQFNLYMGLIRVREKLYMSYSKTDIEGNSLRSALLLNYIKRMFPKLKVLDLDEIYAKRLVVNQPKPTFLQMVQRLNEPNSFSESEMQQTYSWFNSEKQWKKTLEDSEQAIFMVNHEAPLSMETAEKLYTKELKNSVSRLETFAKCPFAHFVDYGLKLKERIDFGVKSPDIGNLFHKVIDRSSRLIEQRNLDWSRFHEFSNEIVEAAVQEVVQSEKRGVFLSNARTVYMTRRLTRIAKRALSAISYQITKGDFRPIAYELPFDATKDGLETLKINFNSKQSMKLTGRIDRLDGYEQEDTLYLSIVDYKSGQNNIDVLAVYYGLQLQLFVYMAAARESKEKEGYNKVIPAGVFFFHIDDPILQPKGDRDKKVIEAEILKQLRLKGLVLDEPEIIKRLDKNIQKASDVIPVSISADGRLAKSSSILSQESFEDLQKYVTEKVNQIGKDIVDGHIDIQPYQLKKETACDYCNYLPICRFERGLGENEYRRLEFLSKDQVFEQIKT